MKSVSAIKRYRTRKLARLVTKAYILRKRGRDAEMFNLICEEFISLGGIYVKFLQGVMLRSEIMKNWHNPNRLRIFENLDSEPLNITALLERELGKEKFSQI